MRRRSCPSRRSPRRRSSTSAVIVDPLFPFPFKCSVAAVNGISAHWLSPVQAPLASRFYAAEGQKERARRDERIAVLRDADGTIIAAARLSPRGDAWLLRALQVARHCQGQGLARQLMQFVLSQPQPLWCFSLPHLQPFYRSLGFVVPDAAGVPAAIADPFAAYCRTQPLVILYAPGAD
nr:GNAT family N-acetyltransferase [Ferrimonas balearica]